MELIPPLTRLRLTGLCCPGLTGQDQTAREACIALKGVYVKWHRKIVLEDETDSESESDDDSVVEKLHGAAVNASYATRKMLCDGINKIATSLVGTSLHLVATKEVGIVSRLDVVDTADGPAFRITPLCSRDTMHNFTDEDDGDYCGRRRPACRTVLLRDVDAAAAGDGVLDSAGAIAGAGISCGIKIYGKPLADEMDMHAARKVIPLLQFDVIETGVDAITRKEVVQHLNALVLWNRQRIAANVCAMLESTYEDDALYVVIEEADLT